MKITTKILVLGVLIIGIGALCDAWAQTMTTNTRAGTNTRSGATGQTFRRINNNMAAGEVDWLNPNAPAGGATATGQVDWLNPNMPADQEGSATTTDQGDWLNPNIGTDEEDTNQGIPAFGVQNGAVTAETGTDNIAEGFNAIRAEFTDRISAAQAQFTETRNTAMEGMRSGMENAGNNIEELVAVFTAFQDTLQQAFNTFITQMTQAMADYQEATNAMMAQLVQNFDTGNTGAFATQNQGTGNQAETEIQGTGGAAQNFGTGDFAGTTNPETDTTTNMGINEGMNLDTILAIHLMRENVPADSEFGTALADFEERYTAAFTNFQNALNNAMQQILQDPNNPPEELTQAAQELGNVLGQISEEFTQAFANYMTQQRQNFNLNNAAAGQNLGLTNNNIEAF